MLQRQRYWPVRRRLWIHSRRRQNELIGLTTNGPDFNTRVTGDATTSLPWYFSCHFVQVAQANLDFKLDVIVMWLYRQWCTKNEQVCNSNSPIGLNLYASSHNLNTVISRNPRNVYVMCALNVLACVWTNSYLNSFKLNRVLCFWELRHWCCEHWVCVRGTVEAAWDSS